MVEEVRRRCAEVAGSARWVTIDPGAHRYEGGRSGLDPEIHLLDAPPEEVARFVLVMDATNFGSGWFAELDLPEAPTNWFTRRLTEHARARGGRTWTPAELRAVDAAEVGEALGCAHPELMSRYAAALRELGAWLGDGGALERVAAAGGSADALVRALVDGLPSYADPGLLKRAQITANDLVLAGVADFADVDRLTAFADDLVPHVLRCDGVLRYAPELAARIDGGEEFAHGSPEEVELRSCAVHAVELLAARAEVPPRTLDNWLWHRGLELDAGGRRPHRTRTSAY